MLQVAALLQQLPDQRPRSALLNAQMDGEKHYIGQLVMLREKLQQITADTSNATDEVLLGGGSKRELCSESTSLMIPTSFEHLQSVLASAHHSEATAHAGRAAGSDGALLSSHSQGVTAVRRTGSRVSCIDVMKRS